MHVTSHNISRNNTANKLNHAVGDTADGVDGDHAICGKVSVVVVVVLGMMPDTTEVGRQKGATSGSVHDENDGSQNAKNENSTGKNVLGRETLDERRDEDGPHALEGLVEALEQAQTAKGAGVLAVVEEGFVVVAVGGEGGDGAVEGLETELVEHDAEDIEGDIATLLGGEGSKPVDEVSPVAHGCRRSVTGEVNAEGELSDGLIVQIC